MSEKTTVVLRPVLLLASMLLCLPMTAAAQALFTGGSRVAGDPELGREAYARACIACHGPRLEGSPFAPALVGEAFKGRWRGKPAAAFLTQMRETMPPKGTGTVPSDDFPHLLAYLVRVNVDGLPPAAPAAVASTPAAAPTVTSPTPLPPEVARRLSSLTPVTEALLAAPPASDWLMWRRTFDAGGFSPLKQIDRGNVAGLEVAWTLPLDASSNEITPLVHEGVMFVYSGIALQAVDAATGKPLWRFVREIARPAGATRQFDPSRRARVKSVALHGHTLFLPTPDGHLVAVDARTGRLLWDKAISAEGGPNGGLQLSSGPLVARGVVIVGASLGLSNKGGCFILGLDAATGAERWRFQTIARPGTPDGDSWNDAPLDERFGGGVWTTGSYDPQLDLVYFGVGNTYDTATLLEPRPGAERVTRNDALYTNATIALRPETGELVWHHQHHRRDVWDQDWAFEQTLVTLGRGSAARRAVVTSGKTGVFEAVDAATGRFLFAHDTGLQNVFADIDATSGAKRPNPALEPVARRTLLLCPSNFGARNWPATSLDPATGTLFVPMLESCADFTYEPRGRKETAAGGSDIRFQPRPRPDGDGKLGRLMALDLETKRIKWTHRQRMPVAGSLLATAGGLVFMADLDRNLGAYDQRDGASLWRTRLPAAAESNPITYAVNGRQYVAVVSGEGSHLGVNNRRLVPELGEPNNAIAVVVYALP